MGELTRIAYLALLGLVGILRLGEVWVSRRNRRRLLARGAVVARDPSFPWMVSVHVAMLAGAAAEVWFLRRPFLPLLAVVMVTLFLAANAVRFWVIASLGGRWSVEIIDASRLGPVTTGPYRYVRHPNYAAVFVEMFALSLIHTAWLTAVFGGVALLFVLRSRARAEDAFLLADPVYRARMGQKPRFIPRLFPRAAAEKQPAVSSGASR